MYPATLLCLLLPFEDELYKKILSVIGRIRKIGEGYVFASRRCSGTRKASEDTRGREGSEAVHTTCTVKHVTVNSQTIMVSLIVEKEKEKKC